MVLWTPAEIEVARWFDASDRSTLLTSTAIDGPVASNNDALARWNDKSSNGTTAIQNTSIYRPVLRENVLASLSVVECSGSSHMGFDPVVTNWHGLICIYKDTSTYNWSTVAGSLYFTANGGGVYHGHQFSDQMFNSTHTQPNTRNGELLRSGSPIAFTAMPRPSEYTLVEMVPVLPPPNATPLTVLMSDNASPNARGIIGGLAEMIIYPLGFEVENRLKVAGYLAHKWGLAESLPSDHPYKSSPPRIGSPTNRLLSRINSRLRSRL